MQKPDIQTEDDIRRLVEAFYGDITDDPTLGRFFDGVDLDRHRPRLVAFWSSIAFQSGTYRGRPFDAHVRLQGLAPHHFEAWLRRFHRTVDERFEGPTAERVKRTAEQIATLFQIKLGLPVEGV
ncbi:hypothetical protein AWN76_011810 [Rhodothermaceae bacterium RA]|nr:hypothetical protein AWN76_011810 [Rhodothermaceae bacterium RA]